MVIHPDGTFEVDGRVTLDVAARDLGLALTPPSPDIETVGAFVESALSDRPVPGDALELDGFRLTILAIRDGRIRRLEGEKLPPPPEEITPGV
jgi:CBS domain containing-hemolysin-like protein